MTSRTHRSQRSPMLSRRIRLGHILSVWGLGAIALLSSLGGVFGHQKIAWGWHRSQVPQRSETALGNTTAAPVASEIQAFRYALLAQPVQPIIAETEPKATPEAPSVLWLIAMPAVPLLGGALIYSRRRLRGYRATKGCTSHAPSANELTSAESTSTSEED